jgi:predicted Fe-S protein YdhL (DUF1289 family)
VPPAQASVASPCINTCRLDASGTLCIGCWRTLDEIAAWGGLDDEQRRTVLAAVEQRKERKNVLF